MKEFNPIEVAKKIRTKMINLEKKTVYCADFTATRQKKDCENIKIKGVRLVIGKAFRAKMYTTPKSKEYPSFVQPAEVAGRKLGVPIEECNKTFLFQVKGCNLGVGLFRGIGCWFCYVDNNNLIPNSIGGINLTAKEILLNYLAEARRKFYGSTEERINVLRVSGGEPTIVPEIIIWLIDEIKRIDLQNHIYLWVDTNLLTGNLFWEALGEEGIKEIRDFPNIGFCGCYKGFDAESFYDNLKINPRFFQEQFKMHKKLIESGFDVYSYFDSTCRSIRNLEKRMDSFLVRLQKEVGRKAPLRVTSLQIKDWYRTTASRIGPEELEALENQWKVIDAWEQTLKRHFTPEELAAEPRAFPKRIEK